jgi:predicted 3-demethylubiquinone-9 3-methyltransferase (glyoxalase superfamily)
MGLQIAPCLWFDGNAEDAVEYYVSVFKDSKLDVVELQAAHDQ